MSADDRLSGHDEYPEDIPTMTLTEPKAATSAQRDPADGPTTAADPSTTPESASVGVAPPVETVGDHRREDESSSETSLFADDELTGLRARWDDVQAVFVDDPRECVQRADGLVSDVVGQLTTGFAQARSHLERQWGRGEEASTEDLRVALTRYRDFFDRLLAV